MSREHRVIVTRKIPQAGLDLLDSVVTTEVWPGEMPPTPEELDELLAGASGALTLLDDRISGEVLDRHPQLRIVSNYAVGYDNIDVDAATSRGVAVGNTPDVLTETTAEFAFTLMLAAARRIVEADAYIKDGKWKTWGPQVLLGQNVVGATLGIVGFGRIGKELARLASGFRMRILATDAWVDEASAREFGAEMVSLDVLLRESDFISIHVALTDETYQMFGEPEFEQMKPTAILVNAARGRVVDTEALHTALTTGQILAAGLDVTDPEPLPADHPLVHLPNCTIAPHIASATVQTRNAMAEIAAGNIADFFSGKRPRAIVNPEVLQEGAS